MPDLDQEMHDIAVTIAAQRNRHSAFVEMLREFWDWISGAKAAREREKAAREREQERNRRLAVIRKYWESGRQLKMICDAPNLILHHQALEQIVCVLPQTMMVEARAIREWQSASSGASVRVAKGFWVHGGGTRGHSESHDELRPSDQGDFIITNQRVVFCGNKRTASMNFNKVLGTEVYADALEIHKEGRDKTYVFIFDPRLTTTIDDVTFKADGPFINAILNQAMRKVETGPR